MVENLLFKFKMHVPNQPGFTSNVFLFRKFRKVMGHQINIHRLSKIFQPAIRQVDQKSRFLVIEKAAFAFFLK